MKMYGLIGMLVCIFAAACSDFSGFKEPPATHKVLVTMKVASDVTDMELAKGRSLYAIAWASDGGERVSAVEYIYDVLDPKAPSYLPLQNRMVVLETRMRDDLATNMGVRLLTNPYVPGSGGPPGGDVIAQADNIMIHPTDTYATVELHAPWWTPCMNTMCGELCVNLQDNAFHCGACGHVCPNPTGGFGKCVNGMCYSICPGLDYTECGNACVMLASDPRNCGACGQVCADMMVCSKGRCTDRCESGTPCSGSCVDTTSDPKHCGACGVQCPALPNATPTCQKGVCNIGQCATGFGNCDGSDVNGCETPLAMSLDHCGACGHVCPGAPMGTRTCKAGMCGIDCFPYTMCGGKCTDVQIDKDNCGGCGKACPQGQVCSRGGCKQMCGPNETECAGACVDLSQDTNNCGACGKVCKPGPNQSYACSNKQCQLWCKAGYLDCDMQPGNGCESESATDSKNCGVCGKVCAQGSTCVAGVCSSAQCSNAKQDGDETDVDCGGSCKPCALGKKCALDVDCGKQDQQFALGWKCLKGQCSEYIQVTAVGMDLVCRMDGPGQMSISADVMVVTGTFAIFSDPNLLWVPARTKNLGDAPPNNVACASTRTAQPYPPKANYLGISQTACGWQ